MAFIEWSFLAVGSILIIEALWWHVRFIRALHIRPVPAPRLEQYPSITVIRPIRGRDADAERNFAAALDTGYPGEVETLFVLDDADDPALPAVKQVLAEHRAADSSAAARYLIAGAPPPGRTGKLNAMIAGVRAAQGELIAFGDSDTRPDHDVLRVAVEHLLADPKAGSAFPPVLAGGPSPTAGDVAYQLMLNAMYGVPMHRAFGLDGHAPFIMGQLMVFRRQALEDIGGVQCAEGRLVDDMAIGEHVVTAGWKNVISPHKLTIVVGGTSVVEFLKILRRWILFQRDGLPRSFTWPMWLKGAEYWVAVFMILAALALGYWIAAIPAAVSILVHGYSLAKLNVAFGAAPMKMRHWLVPVLILLVAPAVHVSAMLKPQVKWRGRRYDLDTTAKLAAGESPAPTDAEEAPQPAAAQHSRF